jgi:manganese transport protein
MAPSFAVGAVGIDATQALILSQVALSLILPVPMIALLILTRRREVMGSFASGFLTMAAATAAIVLAASPRFTKFYLVSLAAERCPSLTFPGMR